MESKPEVFDQANDSLTDAPDALDDLSAIILQRSWKTSKRR